MKIVSIGVGGPCSGFDLYDVSPLDLSFVKEAVWYPSVPRHNLSFCKSNLLSETEGESEPFSYLIFGGDNGHLLSELIKVSAIVRSPYRLSLCGFEFEYEINGHSHTECLGHTFPPPEVDVCIFERHTFNIDGPGGERSDKVAIENGERDFGLGTSPAFRSIEVGMQTFRLSQVAMNG